MDIGEYRRNIKRFVKLYRKHHGTKFDAVRRKRSLYGYGYEYGRDNYDDEFPACEVCGSIMGVMETDDMMLCDRCAEYFESGNYGYHETPDMRRKEA